MTNGKQLLMILLRKNHQLC